MLPRPDSRLIPNPGVILQFCISSQTTPSLSSRTRHLLHQTSANKEKPSQEIHPHALPRFFSLRLRITSIHGELPLASCRHCCQKQRREVRLAASRHLRAPRPVHAIATRIKGPRQMTQKAWGRGDKGDNSGGECNGPSIVIPFIHRFSPGLLRRKGWTGRRGKRYVSFNSLSYIHLFFWT